MKPIYIPCADFNQDPDAKYLRELLLVDEGEMSERELKMIDKASNHGLIYPAVMSEENQVITISSDLGSPSSKFSIVFPARTDVMLAVNITGTVADSLMDGEV